MTSTLAEAEARSYPSPPGGFQLPALAALSIVGSGSTKVRAPHAIRDLLDPCQSTLSQEGLLLLMPLPPLLLPLYFFFFASARCANPRSHHVLTSSASCGSDAAYQCWGLWRELA